ncbi:MBL fold metallo-hydrolase [bacterium]|nr:MBL fold metallo-hydrolase [bacterium]
MKTKIEMLFSGAAHETTGSRHLLMVNGRQILLDCGLYQGHRKDTFERNLNFPFEPQRLNSVILSHAHIDHSGNLPNLTRQGFHGPIYCTPATEDLCRVMLRDSAYIQERDAEWMTKLNRKRQRNGNGKAEPLYTIEDAENCMEQFESIPYHRQFSIDQDIQCFFYDAGHILGSASVVLDIRRGEEMNRLVFSGDIGRADLPLLRDPEIPHNVDWLIMESTYGGRLHKNIDYAKEELRSTVERVAARGGKIIVPSFSVERTQEIIYYLNQLTDEGRLAPIPVYVDSPLAVNVTEVFRLHPECFDEEARKWIMEDKDPFGFYRLTYVRTAEESKNLNNIRFPCMIISASGMCEAGRIRHHLANSISDPKNAIVFVGYQAEGTLGRSIVERKEEVNIFGEPYRVRAEIVTLNSFSAHADQNDLVNYAKLVKESSKLRKVFLVHGETDGLNALAGRLRDELALDVVIPDRGEKIELA